VVGCFKQMGTSGRLLWASVNEWSVVVSIWVRVVGCCEHDNVLPGSIKWSGMD
jgi:hypothetical protein